MSTPTTTTTMDTTMKTTVNVQTNQVPAADHTANTHHRVTLSDVSSPVTFGRVVKSEWIKLLSLRSIRWAIGLSLVLGAALVTLITFGLSTGGMPPTPTEFAIIPATIAVQFGVVIFGVLGVLTITNEYSSGLILSSLTAVPKRGLMFWGKATAVGSMIAVLAILLEIIALVAAGIFEPEVFGLIATADVLTAALGVVVSLTFLGLFAFGLGALLRSAAGAISLVLALVFVLPVVMQFLSMTGWEWVPIVSNYLPVQLCNSLTVGTQIDAGGLGYWPSFGVLALYVAIAVIPAAIAFVKRDAK